MALTRPERSIVTITTARIDRPANWFLFPLLDPAPPPRQDLAAGFGGALARGEAGLLLLPPPPAVPGAAEAAREGRGGE